MTEGWKGGIAALTLGVAVGMGSALAQERTVSIPVDEYEKLKAAAEGDEKDQYWKMSFEQILGKENNNIEDAWEIYEYWVGRTVYLESQVNYSTVNGLIAEIETLNRISSDPITLVVNSPGGGVFSGFSLLNAMEHSEAPIHTVCDSMAISMAAVVAAAGDQRKAGEGCVFMIHEAAVGAPGGQTKEHIKWTDALIDVEDRMVGLLATYSGLSKPDVRTLMEYETFWSGEEATRLGFFDDYVDTTRDRATRGIPVDLLPENRIKRNLEEKLNAR